jgi:hypothetical protein
MTLALRVLTPAEVAEHDEYLRKAVIEWAWPQWELESCTERGGHWWYLTLDPDEGIDLRCLGCSADMGDLYPDDPVLMLTGEFEAMPGYVLTLDEGRVIVNDRYPASRWDEAGPFTYGWRGPVTVNVRTEVYRNWEYGDEYDIFIDLAVA